MKKLTLAVLAPLFVAVLPAEGLEIDVGGRSISIVVPDGYIELAPEHSPYYESMRAYVAESNERELTLIRATDGEAIANGNEIDLTRYLNVETVNALSEVSVNTDMFDEFREITRTELDQLIEQANERIEAMISDGNEEMGDTFGVDVDMSVGDLRTLPMHVDAKDTLGYSMIMKLQGSVGDEDLGDDVIVATMQALHLQDKIVFVYVFGAEDDLEWTRDFASSWANMILAANPVTPEMTVARSTSGGFDAYPLLLKILIGAAIGAGIALLARFRRQKKKVP